MSWSKCTPNWFRLFFCRWSNVRSRPSYRNRRRGLYDIASICQSICHFYWWQNISNYRRGCTYRRTRRRINIGQSKCGLQNRSTSCPFPRSQVVALTCHFKVTKSPRTHPSFSYSSLAYCLFTFKCVPSTHRPVPIGCWNAHLISPF